MVYFACCKILGVRPGSSEEVIKAAFRKSAKELHPDLNDSDKAGQYFIILKNAYHYLLEHQYTEEEIEIIRRSRNKTIRDIKDKKNPSHDNAFRYAKPGITERYTLRYILKNSLLARILFIIFHVLFITVGIYLIFRPIYDLLYYRIHEDASYAAAYIAIIFAFLSGIIITTSFLYTGINYIRRR
ncbi:MAG: DnaJ domain-containing protein [Bacteroidales bacterium]|nr:DnaJ domain-containing protein [Bacteroidales bacterium]